MVTPSRPPPRSRARPPPKSTLDAGRKAKGVPSHPHPVHCPVDTDCKAYARTDPFAALNALRTLLGALPARPGGCALRLRPEEHKLALHLLSLLEPFVGLTPCPRRAALARLPTEVLDHVAFFIDARRDLLALGLACKRLHDVVVPRHAEYRVVRARPSALRVWHHLVVHRALARNVRRLEILDERAGREEEAIPRDIAQGKVGDTDLESSGDELGLHAKQERYVVAAIGRMTGLQSVRWACSHSLVSFPKVWEALERCGSMREIEVEDNSVFQSVQVEDGSEGSEAEDASDAAGAKKGDDRKRRVVLHDLKTVGLHGGKTTFGASKEPDLTRVSTILHHCPNLETLGITYALRTQPGFLKPVADDFLLTGRWSALRHLTLTSLHCTPHAGLDALSTFLAAHPALEVLHLDFSLGAASALKLPPGTLPRLRELNAGRELAGAILACPASAAGQVRPLETLKGIRLGGAARDAVFLAHLRAFGAQTVRRLELVGAGEMEDVRRLAECVPRLTWLDLGRRATAAQGAALAGAAAAGGSGSGAGAKAAIAHVVPNPGEWASVLAQLPELMTFHGVRFFHAVASTDSGAPHLSMSDRSRTRKNDEVASVLAWRCPKLRRLDHWEDGSGRVVVLVRDADRVRYEVRRTKA